jgi:hypothetical protein
MPVLNVEDDRRLAVSLRRSLIESRMAVDLAHDGDEGLAGYLSQADGIDSMYAVQGTPAAFIWLPMEGAPKAPQVSEVQP